MQGESEHKRLKKWYRLTNKHGHEVQIAAKQQRTALLRNIKMDDPEAGKASEVRAEDSQTQRGRGRPRKTAYFGAKDDAGQDEPPTVPFDHHHQISEVQTDPITLLPLVANNQDDPVLKVRRVLLISCTRQLMLHIELHPGS